MSVQNTDLRFAKPIDTIRRSTGTVSGFVDCGIGGINASRALVILDKNVFTGKGSKCVLRVRHTTASGTAYASSTDFSTALIKSTTTDSTTTALAFNIERSGGTGRFLRFLLSTATASSCAGVNVLLSENSKVPPSTTGFTSVTHSPNNP